MIKESNRGFSLVEIMVAVVIIGIILAIALPSYFKSSRTSQKAVCIANLEKIDAAIDQWALENHMPAGTAIAESEEAIYSNYVRGGRPKCPAGGEYTVHTVGAKPQVTCSKEDEGHRLP